MTSSSAVARLSFFVGVPAVDGSPTLVNIPFVIRIFTNSGVPDVPVVSCAFVGPAVAVFRSAVLSFHPWGPSLLLRVSVVDAIPTAVDISSVTDNSNVSDVPVILAS